MPCDDENMGGAELGKRKRQNEDSDSEGFVFLSGKSVPKKTKVIAIRDEGGQKLISYYIYNINISKYQEVFPVSAFSKKGLTTIGPYERNNAPSSWSAVKQQYHSCSTYYQYKSYNLFPSPEVPGSRQKPSNLSISRKTKTWHN